MNMCIAIAPNFKHQAIICLPSDGSWCVSDRSRLPSNYTALLIGLIGGAIVVLRGNKQFMVHYQPICIYVSMIQAVILNVLAA